MNKTILVCILLFFYLIQSNSASLVGQCDFINPFWDLDCNGLVSYDQVWPGDVNNDGIANNIDLLYLGLEYRNSGHNRPNATTNWEGQYMFDWETKQGLGINAKFADCDGNGSVNLDDRDVIFQNYKYSHNDGASNFAGVPLYIKPSTTTLGEVIKVPIILGEKDKRVEDFYGIAFRVEFPQKYAKHGGISVDFNSSFLGVSDVDVMGGAYINYEDGFIEIGISKIDGIQVNGHGSIGTINFITIDDIIGREVDGVEVSSREVTMEFAINNATAFDIDGLSIDISTMNYSNRTNVDLLTSDTYQDENYLVYPNPVKEVLFIECDEKIQKITLSDVNGKVLLETNYLANQVGKHQLNVSGFIDGIYFLKVRTNKGEKINRILFD